MVIFIDEEYGWQYHVLHTDLSPKEVLARWRALPNTIVGNLADWGELRNLDTYEEDPIKAGCIEVEYWRYRRIADIHIHLHMEEDSWIEINGKLYGFPRGN